MEGTYHYHEGPEGPIDGDEEPGYYESQSEKSPHESHIIYFINYYYK